MPGSNTYMADITSLANRTKGMGLAGPGFMACASLAVSTEEQGGYRQVKF
jgi:hypothetical protein